MAIRRTPGGERARWRAQPVGCDNSAVPCAPSIQPPSGQPAQPPSRQRAMPIFLQDVRIAIRTLRKAPAFALGAALVLALAIGATTAIFSLVDATLLRPLPFRDAGRLVRLFER